MSSGIPYFPLDVELDDKVKLIEAEFGLKGFAVVIKLFQKIYGGQGYYCEMTNEIVLLFSQSVGLNSNAVYAILGAAIKRGIFDKTLYDKYQILTSRGIQKRYFEAVTRRKNVEVKSEYLLFNASKISSNVNILTENVDISTENADISKQSRVEESKVKKSKVERGADAPATPSFEDIESYCREKGLKVNPKRFYEYYSAGGWADSRGNKVKNWKQRLLTWNNHEGDKGGGKVADKPKTVSRELSAEELARILKELEE